VSRRAQLAGSSCRRPTDSGAFRQTNLCSTNSAPFQRDRGGADPRIFESAEPPGFSVLRESEQRLSVPIVVPRMLHPVSMNSSSFTVRAAETLSRLGDRKLIDTPGRQRESKAPRYDQISVVFHARWRAPLRMKMSAGQRSIFGRASTHVRSRLAECRHSPRVGGTQYSPSNRPGSVSCTASPRGQQILDILPRYHRRAHREILSHVLRAKDIQGPLQGDANFSVPTGQLAQVNRSP
jgi:hypothetical protein